jgi:hypothetical protein
MDSPNEPLEVAVASVGRALDYPAPRTDGVELAAAVAALLREPREPWSESVVELGPWRRRRGDRSLRPVVRPAWQAVVAAALAVLFVAGGVVAFSPSARDALAGWLGLRGVQIRPQHTPPSASPLPTTPSTPLGENLNLGLPVTLDRARELARYTLVLPIDPALGRPDEVYESPVLPGGLVSLVYGPRGGLTTSPDGVSVLFMEFRARVERRILLLKEVGPGTRLQAVRIGGEPGFWISGQAHSVVFKAPNGRLIYDSLRLSGNALIWQRGDLVLRIEGNMTKAEALAIARSAG